MNLNQSPNLFFSIIQEIRNDPQSLIPTLE